MRVPAALRAPKGAFAETLRVRSYEAGDNGAIGLGTLLRYLELLATDHSASLGFDHRWYERNGTAWFVRTMDIWLGMPPGMDEHLLLATWVADFRRVQARREYAVTRVQDGSLVARASARWGYVDRETGRPHALEDALLAAFARHPDHALPPADDGAPGSPVTSAVMSLTARAYEADSQGHINNAIYGDWLMEAVLGLRHDRPEWFAHGRVFPRRYRLNYVRPVQVGDAVTISTSASALGSRRLVAEQTIADADTGAACLTAHATCLLVP
jgi:acyl-CoA thioester hydrolase